MDQLLFVAWSYMVKTFCNTALLGGDFDIILIDRILFFLSKTYMFYYILYMKLNFSIFELNMEDCSGSYLF